MDSIVQKIMFAFRLDLSFFKEPLGFTRLIEWVFAIFAFASAVGYSGTSSFNIVCQGTEPIDVINVSFAYPFRLSKQTYNVPDCKVNSTSETTYHMTRDCSSSVQFFVTIAVLAFLYCTIILVVYAGYQHVYQESNRWPVVDLVATAIFTFMWLVASSAWGKGLTDLKMGTSPTTLISVIQICKGTVNKCTAGAVPAMGPLNSSVISGFLNLILWGGNCWFIFKETHFHKSSGPSAAQQGGARLP